jgi:hypothetical protein
LVTTYDFLHLFLSGGGGIIRVLAEAAAAIGGANGAEEFEDATLLNTTFEKTCSALFATAMVIHLAAAEVQSTFYSLVLEADKTQKRLALVRSSETCRPYRSAFCIAEKPRSTKTKLVCNIPGQRPPLF